MWVSLHILCLRTKLIAAHADGLASAGNASKIFLKTTKKGLPWVSVVFNTCFAFLAYMGVGSGSGRVFGWFANMTAVTGLMTWFGICVTYLRFYKGLKAQGIDRTNLPFASKLQPYAAIYSGTFCLIICFVCPFELTILSH